MGLATKNISAKTKAAKKKALAVVKPTTVRHAKDNDINKGISRNAVHRLAKTGGCLIVSRKCIDYAKKDAEEYYMYQLMRHMYLTRGNRENFTLKCFKQALANMGKEVVGFNVDRPNDRCNTLH